MVTLDGSNNKITINQHDTVWLVAKLDGYPFTTGDEVYLGVKESYDEACIINLKVIDFENDGSAVFCLSSEDTSIEGGIYYFDICLHTSDGFINTFIKGKIKIIENASHNL